MILIDIKNYLKDKQVVTLQSVSLHFQRDPDTMREMLSHWVRKGVIGIDKKPVNCGTKCLQCKPEIAQVYRYIAY